MKQRTLGIIIAAMLVLVQPAILLADDAPKPYDARLEGYTGNVTLEGGSMPLMWLLFIGLAVVCIGVLFKNANRSHLD